MKDKKTIGSLFLVSENDVYKVERKQEYTLEEIITFKHPSISTYEKTREEWYMTVALAKSDKVKADREQLTSTLLLSYAFAIREGFNHQLDSALKNRYDYPRNRNTIAGIKSYIDKINKLKGA